MNIDDLISMPRAEAMEILDTLSPDELVALQYTWKFWARPAQLAPPGEWNYWMLMAGRGFGKTRVGAEWVRSVAEAGKIGRISLVAPTNADIRGVMLEGESGLLSISPNWFRPKYEPSKSRVVWPNGVIAGLFSAEEPERLRGPQCFAAGTLISTDAGLIPIEEVTSQHRVQTRVGFCKVAKSWQTSKEEETIEMVFSNGFSTRCTRMHLFIDPKGEYKRAEDHRLGDVVCHESQLSLTARNTIVDVTGILSGSQKQERPVGVRIYTATCGKMNTDRYLRGTLCTTATKTNRTIRWKILNSSRFRNILENIFLFPWPETLIPGNEGPLGPQKPAQQHQWWMQLVPLAERLSRGKSRLDLLKNTVQSVATALLFEVNRLGLRGLVPYVARNLSQKSPSPKGVPIAETENKCVSIVSVVQGKREPVYNLTVEGPPEFYANGVLVKNCGAFWADEVGAWTKMQETWDQLQFGFRLGRHPQGVITTTPRPVQVVRDLVQMSKDGSCVITRGSTYDNRQNLAAPFFKKVVTAYEGTRLGRQELDGDLLEDNPNALFTQEQIDDARVAEAPSDLHMVVVAVDPNVTDNVQSDEAGIVTVGSKMIGEVLHYFVMCDDTVSGSPDAWGRKAAAVYHREKANLVVAEANNGGDLVVSNITNIDNNVPVRKVIASRGKTKRAEPVSTLYEQGRVHHVGPAKKFEKLEDQMCAWDPTVAAKQQKSPDRMDALVWGVSYLMTAKKSGMVQTRATG